MIYREKDVERILKGELAGEEGTIVIDDSERDQYEVEFVNPDGTTRAMRLYRGHELQRI
jgi:hypothetical protein